jgi:PAS domain S-box-containing protein
MNPVTILILISIIIIVFSIMLVIKEWKKSIWFNSSLLQLIIFMLIFLISNFLESTGLSKILDPYESFFLPVLWSLFFFRNMINLQLIDLHKTQDALRASNRKFRLVTETIQDMFWLDSAEDDRSLLVSSGIKSVFDESFDVDLNTPPKAHYWLKAIREQEREFYSQQIKKKVTEGQPYRLEYKIETKSGKTNWILEKGYPIRNEKGQIEIIAGVCSNITDRKLTELALKKNEEKLRIILSSIGDAVITTDTEGKVEWLNKTAEKITGWSSVDAQGKRLSEVINIISNTNRSTLIDPVKEVLSAGDILEIASDAILVDRNGKEYHIADSAAPIKDDQGTTHGVVIAFTDVTANYNLQQQVIDNNERLELAISGGQLGTWDWDFRNGTVIYNNWWASMLGYSTAEIEPSFSFWENLIHPDDISRVLSSLNEHLQGNTRSFESEYRLRTKSGDYVWVLAKGKVIMRDMDGQPLRICGTNLDITSRKKSQQQLELQKERLRLMNERLLKANKSLDDANIRLKELDLLKNDFIALASHELRTPVTTVLGFAQTLLTPGLIINDSRRNEYLKIIEKEAIRLGKLINDLLNISAIEKEHTTMNLKCESLNQIVQEAIDSMTPSENQIIRFADGHKQLQVYCNKDQIIQVFRIILENALRYGNDILVKIEEDTAHNLVSIHDNGPGIAFHHLKSIFEKFYRVQGEQKPGKGSGLGLAIAKDIITAHGGQIWAESTLGKGSTFIFTLKKCQT